MPLQLRDNVHWCNCAGRAVFLDVEADRYFCLPAAANESFLRLAHGHLQPDDTERLRMLVTRGVLVEQRSHAHIPQPPDIEPPARDWLAESSSGPRLMPVLRAFAWEMLLARSLRARPLREVLAAARRRSVRKKLSGPDQHALLHTIVRASAAVSYLARVQDRCLVRALAVHAICRRNGITPKLVFGVIAHPFAAHSWVQLGDAVLVGGCEHARLYTPILVVE
jgi:hypothetical protein